MAKSIEKAVEFRQKGNDFYAKHDFFQALVSYNKSLRYAPSGSEAESHVYANRAAVYLECKLFEKCLINIQRACDRNYPKPEILEKRRERCMEMMAKGEDPRYKRHKFQLSYPPHPKFPSMVECLEFRKDELNSSPHVYATQDLHVGDIIAFAEPIAPVLNHQNIGLRCSFCLKDNLFDLCPCPSCTKGRLSFFLGCRLSTLISFLLSVMYCSDECKKTAFKLYHHQECGFDGFIPKSLDQVPIRIFLEALSVFDGKIDDFESFMNEHKDRKHFLLDFDFSDPTSIESAKNRILAVDSLYHNQDENSMPWTEFIDDSLEEFFETDEKLKSYWKQNSSFISSFIKKQMSIFHTHKCGVNAWPLKIGGIGSEPAEFPSEATNSAVADTIYPLMLCFNHSCIPNVGKMSIDGKWMYNVSRPIKAGAEVFDSYVASFEGQPKILRQRELKNFYNIDCKCEACVENYPVFQRMRNAPGKFRTYAMKEYRNKIALETMNPEQLWPKLHEYGKVIEQNQDKVPSPNLMMIQGCMISVLINLNKPEFLFD